MLDVIAIHPQRRVALMSNDNIFPIAILYDRDGEETDELDEAVAFSVEAGRHGWFTGRLDWFVPMMIQ